MFKRCALLVLLCVCACGFAAADAPLADPMRPYRPADSASAPQSAEPRYRLTAVLIADDRRIAVINGKRVREGDRVDGAELTRIGRDRVELRRSGRQMVLTLRAPARSAHRKDRDSQRHESIAQGNLLK